MEDGSALCIGLSSKTNTAAAGGLRLPRGNKTGSLSVGDDSKSGSESSYGDVTVNLTATAARNMVSLSLLNCLLFFLPIEIFMILFWIR